MNPIVTGKVLPPVLRRSVVERPRLLGWLEQRCRERLVVVSAEAGYGKTTLLADLARRSKSVCVWYRLETSDADWMTIISYLVAAIRQRSRDFGTATEALLRNVASMGPSRDVVLSTFLVDLEALGDVDIILILDDVHLVSGSDDLAHILGRLLEHAPNGLHLVLSGRGRPDIPIGRMAAQGRSSELTTRDLRFTRSEVEEFFSAHGQPLRRETCDIVLERTEGWAASLQLLAASMASGRPDEVETLIDGLDGASGSLYDFLAEEVLSRLPALTQRVLVHAALLDRIKPELVTAALATTAEPVDEVDVVACLHEVETVGLIEGGQVPADGSRLHPLLRQFLDYQLRAAADDAAIREMHIAIARVAEPSDWLVAGKHYAAAGSADDAMSVLGRAASQALGSGAWGAAAEIVDSFPDITPPPAVQVIRARALTSDGDPEAALEALDAVAPDGGWDEALLSVARAAALHASGKAQELFEQVGALGSTSHSDAVISQITRAWRSIGTACEGGPISQARQDSENLLSTIKGDRLPHFSAISHHNVATASLAMGDYDSAIRHSIHAVSGFERISADAPSVPSAIMTRALAMAEKGEIQASLILARNTVRHVSSQPDALADASYLLASTGYVDEAIGANRRVEKRLAVGLAPVGSAWQLGLARIALAVSQGDFENAGHLLRGAGSGAAEDLDGFARRSFVELLLASVSVSARASDLVRKASGIIERQQAWRWEYRVRLIGSLIGRDQRLARVIDDVGASSFLCLLDVADVIGSSLHLLDVVPESLRRSMAQCPQRWRPVLIRQIQKPDSPNAPTAALMLAEIGSVEDARHLEAYERAKGGRRRLLISQRLAHRLSPTLRIRDLGRTAYEVAGHIRPASEARRKATALLLYLATRPRQTAPRDQALEQLWPRLDPAAAMNSLHQTLHFIRRDIAPWQEELASAEYVPLDSEVLYLNPDLVLVDSVAFVRQAAEALADAGTSLVHGPPVLRLYTGMFAPEFEYEEWSHPWRDHVHAAFLHLAHRTTSELIREKRVDEAIEVLTPVAAIDPMAYDLRTTLMRCLAAVGARDSARAHYRSMAALVESDLGARVHSFEDVLEGQQLTEE